jgi:hypothetical protein
LISFNLDRYHRAEGRPQKSKVVNSIVDQLTYAGCRFVKICERFPKDITESNGDGSVNCKGTYIERYQVMNLKQARLKVSHALRDKRQNQDHEAALARLKIRSEICDGVSDIPKDSLYIAANAMILTVNLSGQESETPVKALLCDAIDNVGISIDAGYNHDYDHKHNSIPSSNDGVDIEVLNPFKEEIPSSHVCIRPTERLPPAWPIPISLQVGPVILCNGDHVSGERSQDHWISDTVSSSNEYVLDHG